jgi:hypothetical protein
VAETDQGGEFVALTDDRFGVGGAGAQGLGYYVGGELPKVRLLRSLG